MDYAEKVIREICKEMGIEIIRMAVNSEYIHMFFKNPPKYSVSYIANIIKGKSSRMLWQKLPKLKDWCKDSSSFQIATAICQFHGSVGTGWDSEEFCENSSLPSQTSFAAGMVEKYISQQKDYATKERVDAIKKRPY